MEIQFFKLEFLELANVITVGMYVINARKCDIDCI